MPNEPRDPRTESEKALADLKRNDEMGLAIPESEAEQRPSVTPETFGVHDNAALEEVPVDRENRDDPLPQIP